MVQTLFSTPKNPPCIPPFPKGGGVQIKTGILSDIFPKTFISGTSNITGRTPPLQKGGRGDFNPIFPHSPDPIILKIMIQTFLNPSNPNSDIVLYNKARPFGRACCLNCYKLLTV